jgi:putative endonuclease
MAYFVYILKSQKDGNYYIGSTHNVEARLEYHNLGKQRSTRNRIPFTLIYSEELPDKSAALKRERQIKKYKGGNAFRNLIGGV